MSDVKYASSRERSAAAIQAMRDGMSLEKAAEQYGYSWTTLYKYALLAGIKRAKKPEATAIPKRRLALSSLRVLARLLNTDDTVRKIAEDFGCTRQWIDLVKHNAVGEGIKIPHRAKAIGGEE